ncbi:unnamed protein product [Penicillium crustosum]
MFRATSSRMAGFVFRENRVPYYQRLFQNHDGKRQWWKVSTLRKGHLCPQLSFGQTKKLTMDLSCRPPAPVTSCTPTSSRSTASVLLPPTPCAAWFLLVSLTRYFSYPDEKHE